MNIILGKEHADMLREKYTVLDLETIKVDDQEVDVFCVVPADKIGMVDLPTLKTWIKLHHEFLQGYKTKQYSYCLQCIEYLRGKFGGELDTFYDEIERRITEEENSSSKKSKKKKSK